jgi:hypothetical protein
MCLKHQILRLIRDSIIFGILAILVSYCISYAMNSQFVTNREKTIFFTCIISYLVYYFYINLMSIIKVY